MCTVYLWKLRMCVPYSFQLKWSFALNILFCCAFYIINGSIIYLLGIIYIHCELIGKKNICYCLYLVYILFDVFLECIIADTYN